MYLSFLSDTENPGEKGNYTASLFLSTLLGVGVGTIIALAGGSFLLSRIHLSAERLLILGGILAVVLLLGQPLIRKTLVKIGLARDSFKSVPLSLMTKVFLIQLVFCWLAEGMGAVCLLKGVGIEVSATSFLQLMASFAIASLAGYLSLLTPAGIGVREVSI